MPDVDAGPNKDQYALLCGWDAYGSGVGIKQSFSDDSQNDCFGVLSGSSERKCLLWVERTQTPVASHGGFWHQAVINAFHL